MKAKFFFTIIAITFMLSVNAQQQEVIRPLHSGGRPLTIGNLPFSKIIVVDCRLDSSYVYVPSNNMHPAQRVQFSQPLTEVFEDYLKQRSLGLNIGSDVLLLRVEQCSMPNIFHKTVYRRADSSIGTAHIKNSFDFRVAVFRKLESGEFRKILVMDKGLAFTYKDQLHITIASLLDQLLVALTVVPDYAKTAKRNLNRVQKAVLKDTVSFKMGHDTVIYSLREISANVSNSWVDFPIFGQQNITAGIFNTFEEFREGKAHTTSFKIRFDPYDSLWKTTLHDPKTRIWGVYDGVAFFIHLYDSVYIRLLKEKSTFSFQLPYTLPDMHTLLSLEEVEHMVAGSTLVHGDGLFAVFATVVSNIGDQAIASKRRQKQKELILKGKQKNMYRKCYLNMYNGDIIF